MKNFTTAFLCAAMLLALSSRGTAASPESPKFQTIAANNASQEYLAATTRARTAYASELDIALQATMSARDLPEANLITQAKTALTAGAPPPGGSFKSLRANQARTTYNAAMERARAQYTTTLQAAIKIAMAAGNLDDANRIQSEIKTLAGAPVSTKSAPEPKSSESSDLAVSGKGFTIEILQNDAQAFSNRGYIWEKVPPSLRGLRYTKVAGGTHPQIIVRAKRDTTLQVMIAMEQGAKTTGWERTGTQLNYNSPKKAEVIVFKRKMNAGETLDIPQENWAGILVLLPKE